METPKKVLEHYNEVVKWCGKQTPRPTVMATMLYGSQNYGLATLDSDVDTKTIVLPDMDRLIAGGFISTEITMPDGSLDNCKDIRKMFDNYLKVNINFLETLFTFHYVVNEKYKDEFNLLRTGRELVANCQPYKLLQGAIGMAIQKYKGFDHPFAGKQAVLAKYGYDPKQLHHLARLYHFIRCYNAEMNFGMALQYCFTHNDVYEEVMTLKTHPLMLTDAVDKRKWYMEHILEIGEKSNLPKDDGFKEANDFLKSLASVVIKRHVAEGG